jgi:hypothetical protein
MAVKHAVSHPTTTNGTPHTSDQQVQCLLEVMPAAAYTTDSEGLITGFNRRAVELWGREPKLNDPVDRH